jgi:hypothetical protein
MKEVTGEPIVGLVPSIMRRCFGCGVLFALGFLLLYIAAVKPPDGLQWILVLVLIGAGAAYAGYRMWHWSGHMIELTDEGLRMSDGTVIARLEDIHAVDRSFFAFKPSNGFLVTLKTKYPTTWIPGLWWRVGKRIGIGGLTSASEGKIMADTMSAMIAERDGLIDLS